jgi:hypothetical protein
LSVTFAFINPAVGFFVTLLAAGLVLDTALFKGLVVLAGATFTALTGAVTFVGLAAIFATFGAGLFDTFVAGLAGDFVLALIEILADFFVAAVLVELFVTTDVSFFAGFFIALAIESNQPKLKSYLKFIKRKYCNQQLLNNRTLMQKSNSTFLSIGVLGYSEEQTLT